MPIFEQSVIAAVLAHMNGDHTEDNLLIARAFGDPQAETSRMTGLDDTTGAWVYEAAGRQHELSVPWSTTIAERAEIRREIVLIYERACAVLGVAPRPH